MTIGWSGVHWLVRRPLVGQPESWLVAGELVGHREGGWWNPFMLEQSMINVISKHVAAYQQGVAAFS